MTTGCAASSRAKILWMARTIHRLLFDPCFLHADLDRLAVDWVASGEDVPFVEYCLRPDVAKKYGHEFEEFMANSYKSDLWAAHEYLDYAAFREWCAEVGVDHVTALRILEEDGYVEGRRQG